MIKFYMNYIIFVLIDNLIAFINKTSRNCVFNENYVMMVRISFPNFTETDDFVSICIEIISFSFRRILTNGGKFMELNVLEKGRFITNDYHDLKEIRVEREKIGPKNLLVKANYSSNDLNIYINRNKHHEITIEICKIISVSKDSLRPFITYINFDQLGKIHGNIPEITRFEMLIDKFKEIRKKYEKIKMINMVVLVFFIYFVEIIPILVFRKYE